MMKKLIFHTDKIQFTTKERFFLKKGKHDNGLQKILAIIKKNAPFRFVRKDALSF